MKYKYIKLTILTLALLLFFKFTVLPPSDRKTRVKLELIEDELSKNGYHPSWIVISEKRSKFYNSLLNNSVKNSYHLQGKAIDILVFDINRDGSFNKVDIDLFRKAVKEVEKEHPGLKGGMGTYTNRKFPTNKMIHVDTRGYTVYYNY